MRIVFVVNPAAGGGMAGRVAGSVAALLRGGAERVEPVMAADAEGTARACRRAVSSGADALVVLGGDGAAHVGLQACAGSATALGVVPAGTGNDLATELGMPTEPLAAARVVATALRSRSFARWDLGRVAGGSWFSTVLCAGFDAAVNERVNAMRWPRGKRRYDLGVLVELVRLRAAALRVEVDAGVLELAATLVAVGNTRTYGGGILVCPEADPADGMLDVTVVGEVNRRELLGILPRLRTAEHVRHPAVTTLRARSVRLAGQTGWTAFADGERQARLPVGVRCVPGALWVVRG